MERYIHRGPKRHGAQGNKPLQLTLIKMPVPSRLESGLVSGCPKAVTAWMPLEKGPVSRASVIPVPPLASVLVCPALSRVPDWVLPEMET